MTEPSQFHGPYLAAGFICEQVIEGKDGVMSYIRELDRFTVTAQGPNAPESLQRTDLEFKLVLHFKSGDARGRHDVKVEPEPPSGLSRAPSTFSILLEGEDRGARLVLHMRIAVEEEGLHWFNVYLDEMPFTRLPLRILYQRVTTAPPPNAGS